MVEYINQFLDALKAELPKICADKDLVTHLPNIFKNPSTLTRMRERGLAPAHFSITPYIYYLRDDVICWLRGRYQSLEILNKPIKQKKPSRCAKKKHSGARR